MVAATSSAATHQANITPTMTAEPARVTRLASNQGNCPRPSARWKPPLPLARSCTSRTSASSRCRIRRGRSNGSVMPVPIARTTLAFMISEATCCKAGIRLSMTKTASRPPSSRLKSPIDIAPGASSITPGTAPTTWPVSSVTAIPSTEPRIASPIVSNVLPGATRIPYRSRVSTAPTVTAPTDKSTRVFRSSPEKQHRRRQYPPGRRGPGPGHSMPWATTVGLVRSADDRLRVRLGIPGGGQAVQGLLQYGGVLQRPDLGDLAPADPEELVNDVVVPGAVDDADVDGYRGGDPGVPRPAGDQDVLDLEAGVRQQPETAFPPPAQGLVGTAFAGQRMVPVETVGERRRHPGHHRLPVARADLLEGLPHLARHDPVVHPRLLSSGPTVETASSMTQLTRVDACG